MLSLVFWSFSLPLSRWKKPRILTKCHNEYLLPLPPDSLLSFLFVKIVPSKTVTPKRRGALAPSKRFMLPSCDWCSTCETIISQHFAETTFAILLITVSLHSLNSKSKTMMCYASEWRDLIGKKTETQEIPRLWTLKVVISMKVVPIYLPPKWDGNGKIDVEVRIVEMMVDPSVEWKQLTDSYPPKNEKKWKELNDLTGKAIRRTGKAKVSRHTRGWISQDRMAPQHVSLPNTGIPTLTHLLTSHAHQPLGTRSTC